MPACIGAGTRYLQGLTPRERETLCDVVRGDCNKEIAARSGVTVRMIKWHLSSVLAKTGCESRARLIAMAFHPSYQADPRQQLIRRELQIAGCASADPRTVSAGDPTAPERCMRKPVGSVTAVKKKM